MSNYKTFQALQTSQTESISDYFNDVIVNGASANNGEWINYAALSELQTTQLLKQKHTDIRTFYKAKTKQGYLRDLNGKTMSSFQSENILCNTTYDNIGPIITLYNQEPWSAGTITVNANGWNQLEVSLSAGTTTLTSTTTTSDLSPVIDLSSYNVDNDFISIALPSLPASTDLSRSSTIKFVDANNVSSNVITLTAGGITNSAGSQEMQFSLSALGSSFDKSKITKVVFSLTANNSCTFRCMAIRCLAADWVYAPLDINTVEKKVAKPAPLNGNSTSSAFPDTTVGTTTSVWPTILRSLGPSFTENDPKVINGELVTIFNTGTINSGSESNIKNYYRVIDEFTTQGDLDGYGSVSAKTQQFLNTTKNIDALASNIIPRLQKDISKIPGQFASLGYQQGYESATPRVGWNQNQLDDYDQGELQSIISTDSISYESIGIFWRQSSNATITSVSSSSTGYVEYTTSSAHGFNAGESVTITGSSVDGYNGTYVIASTSGTVFVIANPTTGATTWTSGTAAPLINKLCKIKIDTEIGTLYTFEPFAIEENTDYAFYSSIDNDTVYAKIYKINNDKTLTLVHKIPQIVNEQFHRRRGKIGWAVNLINPSACIKSIRSGGLVYAEYKTSQMPSHTPIKAAQLIADCSPNINLFTELNEDKWSSNTVNLTLDESKSDSKLARKISTTAGGYFEKGVVTNSFKVEDPNDIHIEFNLWLPSDQTELSVFLYQPSEDGLTPLYLPPFKLNQWDKIQIKLNDKILPGIYQLAILQQNITGNSIWWIDKIKIQQKSMNWEARSSISNAWQFDADDWIDFKNTVNLSDGGVMLPRKGTGLQLKGKAMSHYASIESVKTVPVYATLGNIVWNN